MYSLSFLIDSYYRYRQAYYNWLAKKKWRATIIKASLYITGVVYSLLLLSVPIRTYAFLYWLLVILLPCATIILFMTESYSKEKAQKELDQWDSIKEAKTKAKSWKDSQD